MKIKVCGMKYADNIREVAKLSPDFMGFIFYPKSKRYVGEDFIMPQISSSIKKVGVFVNAPTTYIASKVGALNLDFIQLHGNETPKLCSYLDSEFRRWKNCSTKIIKAFGIDEHFNFSILKEYESSCEYFLFDTKSSDYGGTGKEFDRSALWNYKLTKPYFLSGGISLEEVRSQKSELRNAYALDVNSKFETKPGFKDISKLKKLFDEVHG